MSETLEAMARALFKSWFVDFDPVRAKAEGRDPGLPQPLADVFPPASSTPNSARFRRGGRSRASTRSHGFSTASPYRSTSLLVTDRCR